MNKQHDTLAFFITLLLYIFAVGFFAYLQKQIKVSEEVSKEKIVHMHLSSFVPEKIPQKIEEQKPEQEPEKELEVQEKLTKEVQKIFEPPIKKVHPPTRLKKKIKPVTLPQKKVHRKKKIKKRSTKKEAQKKYTSKRKQKRLQHRQKKSYSSAKRNKFLSQLRYKIDRHKTYPRIAQKRGMQGSVTVRFVILANGNVGRITLDGPKIFHHSARNAVKKCFPINVKNAPLSLPATVNITLRYRMR